MKRAVLALAGLVFLATTVQAAPKNNVKIKNKSDWEIHHFFLSSVDDEEWGPDQLGDDVIGTGESFELRKIPCGSYDVMLVDEDGDECIVSEVDVCSGSEGWVITNEDLLECQAETEGE
ncbi:MAG TPA: hypothetical protein VF756_20150 [Thermoanaerobaculia bacterium]